MSRKEKKTCLYSRNGIKIERTDFIDVSKFDNQKNMGLCVKTTFVSTPSSGKKVLIKGSPARTEIIKKESPLGFYYYQKRNYGATEDRYVTDSITYVKYTVKYRTSRYEFTYPIKYNDVKISAETRPWDILPGYKGMPDHFITALHNEINKMLNVWKDEGIRLLLKERSYSMWDGWIDAKISDNTSWITKERENIFWDMFRNSDGPSINYNDIKIESHGFDKKVSFRKRKES